MFYDLGNVKINLANVLYVQRDDASLTITFYLVSGMYVHAFSSLADLNVVWGELFY